MKLKPDDREDRLDVLLLDAEEVLLDRACATSPVRGSVAPDGSVQITMPMPWSSCGKKPVGSRVKQQAHRARRSPTYGTSHFTRAAQHPRDDARGSRASSASKPRLNQPNGPRRGAVSWPARSSDAHIAGVTVSATNTDSSIDATIVIENWR